MNEEKISGTLSVTGTINGTITIGGGGGGSESSDFVIHYDVKEVPDYMFYNQEFKIFKIESVNQPVYIGTYAFINCLKLERVEFPLVASFGTAPFANCPIKDYYIGRSSKGATGQSAVVPYSGFSLGAFVQDRKIHVPADLVLYYKNTTGWRSYADMIVGDYDA